MLDSRAESDDSLRLDILTESFGLLSARVQGARATRSKLRSGSQEFSVGDFSLIHGKAGWKVVSVRAEKNIFEALRSSSAKLKVAGNVLLLLKRLMGEEDRGSVFEISVNFVKFLEGAKEEDLALAECLTLLRILHCLGYMRHDPSLTIPIASSEIATEDLVLLAPRRAQIVELINESLKATQT